MKSFKRYLKPPSDSFFLFGPRGTGKSTWLQSEISAALQLVKPEVTNYEGAKSDITELQLLYGLELRSMKLYNVTINLASVEILGPVCDLAFLKRSSEFESKMGLSHSF